MIKGKAATQDSDREGEREARAFLGRHYTRQVMDRQRAGQNRIEKIIEGCKEQGREFTGADLEPEFDWVEEDNEAPTPDDVLDALEWTWLDYCKKNRGRFDLSVVFPELSRQELEELEKELLEGKDDNVRRSSREAWDTYLDIPPGKAPWDRNQEDPEGGAGGSHPVGVFMMREDRDRSRSRSTSPTTPPYRDWSPDHVSEGEEEGISAEERRHIRRYRRRIEGVDPRYPGSRRGPFSRQWRDDQISRYRQRSEGRRGTGLPNRWLFQNRSHVADYLASQTEGGATQNYDNYPDNHAGPEQEWVEPSMEEAIAEQPTWEEQVALLEYRKHRKATQERFPPTSMPKGFVPLKQRFNLKGPAPGVGFRRRTDYGDGAGGLQAPMRQDMGMDGRLAARELNDSDIPADNIGVEILRGSKELPGRRLPRYLRGIRTEEDEFPYRHPMTEALARHEGRRRMEKELVQQG